MAGSKSPSPICVYNNPQIVNDGTLVRAASPQPCPAGRLATASSPKPHCPLYHRIHVARGILPTLRRGVRDDYVRWLQILLNLHKAATPPLKTDGYFGPKTLEAVIDFQKSSSLRADGVVGLQSWLKVQVIQAELPQIEAPAQQWTMPSKTPDPQPEAPASVADWSLTRRFMEVVKLAPKHMAPELAAQFRAMLTPFNLSILVGTLVAWAVSHTFGAGEAADIVLSVVGVFFMGLAVFRAGYDIGDCLVITVGAQKYADLDTASDRLAEAVAILGVVVFFAFIAKVAAKFGVGEKIGAKLKETGDKLKESLRDDPPPPKKTAKTQSEPEPAVARQGRLNELAKDPAHGGRVTPKGLQEAEVGLSCEENGKIPGPLTRDPSGAAEFIDGNGRGWDVKGFNSKFPPEKGGFDLETDLGKIQDEVAGGENVIVDTTNMSAADVGSLRSAVQGAGLANNVVWYP